MIVKEYNKEELTRAKQYLSSDALLIHVCDALARKKPLSLVRMGDGEKMIVKYSQGEAPHRYLTDKIWLQEYGLWKADLKKVGQDLIKAANEADFFCPNISGLVYPKYEMLSFMPKREQYGEGLFAHSWLYMGRVPELMNYSGGIAVVCRSSINISYDLGKKYNKIGIHSIDYDSWKDYDRALELISLIPAHLILVSAGASGKYLVVEAAKKTGKVVIDTGSALIRHWSQVKTREI